MRPEKQTAAQKTAKRVMGVPYKIAVLVTLQYKRSVIQLWLDKEKIILVQRHAMASRLTC
jgi:hypothetical protein